MALHGHTLIELTNTETGEVRTIEDDNIVTNYIKETILPRGILGLNGYTWFTNRESVNWKDDMLESYTKGLLLFDAPIDEDPDMMSPPAGVRMTGHAGYNSYSGKDLSIGSYNEAESGKIENGFKHVWDFGTSQGNGPISCACLTTQAGGILGAGSAYFDASRTTFKGRATCTTIGNGLGTLYSKGEKIGSGGIYAYPVRIDLENNYFDCLYRTPDIEVLQNAFCIDSYDTIKPDNSPYITQTFIGERKLSLARVRMPIGTVNIFDHKAYDIDTRGVLEYFEIEMPDNLKQALSEFENYALTQSNQRKFYQVKLNYCEEKVYITFSLDGPDTKSLPSFLVWEIDTVSKTSKAFKVYNGLPDNATLNISPQRIFATPKYLFAQYSQDNKNYMCAISLENSTEVHDVTDIRTGERVLFEVPTGIFDSVFYQNGKIYCKPDYNDRYSSAYDSANYPFYSRLSIMCIDTELLEVSYISGLLQESESLDYMYPYSNSDLIGPRLIVPISGSKLLYYSCANSGAKGSEIGSSYPRKTWIFSTCPLVTINNLPQTVIKTTAETMKVTYTVTYE